MSNVIQFPMYRIRTESGQNPSIFGDWSGEMDGQLSDLEAQTLDILDQAIALEKQSQRILDLYDD